MKIVIQYLTKDGKIASASKEVETSYVPRIGELITDLDGPVKLADSYLITCVVNKFVDCKLVPHLVAQANEQNTNNDDLALLF